MRFFAIADLHLPGGDERKAMSVFGSGWEGHFRKISDDWRERVSARDVVLLPGDLSWAMDFEAALRDLSAICSMPGVKIILKGNHDFWWSSISKVRGALFNNTYAIQNDALVFGGVAVAGSRGWEHAGVAGKVQKREIMRTELSLKAAQARSPARIIAMAHFPPFGEKGEDTEFTKLFERYGVSDVVYGHLHGAGAQGAKTGEHGGVAYHLVSCDSLGFRLYEIPLV